MCIERYLQGKTNNFVYTAKLKDEPRTISKCKNGNTRVFYMTPLPALILARMFLTPVYTTMVEHNELYCTAVGIDTHRAAHEMYERLQNFSPYMFCGDYEKFDQSMPNGVSGAVSEIIFNILKYFGYNEKALKVTMGLLSDNMFPYICVLGDIFKVPGLQLSGKFATAEDNS